MSSDDLSEDWVNNTLEFVMESKSVGEALMFCTQQYSALSDEELSDGDEDDDEGDEEEEEDDGFDDECFSKVEKGPKKSYTPEPQIDTSKFIIPAGYEPGGVQAIVQQYRDILKTSREERVHLPHLSTFFFFFFFTAFFYVTAATTLMMMVYICRGMTLRRSTTTSRSGR